MKMHDVFHVSLLKAYHEDGSHQPPPVTILLEGEPEHEVEKILNHRQENERSKSYLVRWTGYGPENDTWEPDAAMRNCRDLVQAYKTENDTWEPDAAMRNCRDLVQAYWTEQRQRK